MVNLTVIAILVVATRWIASFLLGQTKSKKSVRSSVVPSAVRWHDPSNHQSVCPSLRLSVRLSVCLSLCFHLSVYLSQFLSVHWSVRLFILPAFLTSAYRPICLFVRPAACNSLTSFVIRRLFLV